MQDYLGLIGTQKNFRGGCQLAVLPEPVLSTRVRTGMEKQQEYRYSAVADDDSDILDLRAFRPGDNLNHIHWNLSLRTDDLIVRQYGEQIDVKKVILVDLSILNTAQYRSRMDAVYTAVASIANLYVENEVNTLILAWNGQKQSAEYLEVHDRTELNRAMIRLMQIPCSSRAGEHAAAVYLKDIEAQGQQALFVTAGSYENNKVRIVNVEKIQLQDSVIREMVFGNGVSLQNDGMRVIYTGIDSAQNRQEEVYHLLQVPRGGEYRLTLADGTDVWLNSDSRLRYPVYFRSGQRRVYLEGEAYFQVRRDTLHPFIVEAADRLSIEVLGTGFNVQAYPEEKEIYTTLNTGSVKVCHGQQEVILQPDQQAIYSLAGGPIEIHPVKSSRVSAWKDGQFLFEEAELETILLRLGRWYNLDIFYADPEVKGFHFTGDLEKYEDYTLIFKMLEKATKIKFEIKNHTVIVRSVK